MISDAELWRGFKKSQPVMAKDYEARHKKEEAREEITKGSAPVADERLAAYVRDWATRQGWKSGDAEGPFQYAQRISYAQGMADARPYWVRAYVEQEDFDKAVADAIERVSERVERAALASAPVAGEPVAYAIHNIDLKGEVRVYGVMPWTGPHCLQDDAGWGSRWAGNRPLVYGDAAPQASEAVRPCTCQPDWGAKK